MSREGSWGRRLLGKVALGLTVGLLWTGPALAGGAGEAGGLDPAQVTDFIWRSFNFLVFAAILVYLLGKKFPVKDIFAARSQDIAQSFEDLEAKKVAAAQALKEAEERLAQVATERDKIIQQYLAEGEMEKARMLAKAEEVARRIKEMAALTIQQETKKAAQELKREVVDLATQLAEDLIKDKVTPADQQQLVEEYLKKVVEVH